MNRLHTITTRIGAPAALAVTAYLHADLYFHGYRAIPKVGPGFAFLAVGGFAVAALLPITQRLLLRLAAAGLATGALIGFVASRTVGFFGFTERGLQPAPQALISLITEVAVLLLLGADLLARRGMTRPAPAAVLGPAPTRERSRPGHSVDADTSV